MFCMKTESSIFYIKTESYSHGKYFTKDERQSTLLESSGTEVMHQRVVHRVGLGDLAYTKRQHLFVIYDSIISTAFWIKQISYSISVR